MAVEFERRAQITGTGLYRGPINRTNFDTADDIINSLQPGDKPATHKGIDKLARGAGIEERGNARKDQASSDMAIPPIEDAIKMAGIQKNGVKALVMAVNFTDHPGSSTAAIVQDKIGLPDNIQTVDIVAGCPGFIHALKFTFSDVENPKGLGSPQICAASEPCSKAINPRDRLTYILFGDGAGAVVVEAVELPASAPRADFAFITKGRFLKDLYVPGGGSRDPDGERSIHMNGKVIASEAVASMCQVTEDVLSKVGAKKSDIDLLIPHQANLEIIKEVAKKLEFPMERVYVNIQRYGNTSAASIPIAMTEAFRDGRLKKGNIVLAPTFGAGLNAAAAFLPMYGLPERTEEPTSSLQKAA